MNTPTDIVINVPANVMARRLDAWLAGQLADSFSRARLQGLITDGAVFVDGRAAGMREPVRPGMCIRIVVPPPTPAIPEPEDIPLDIVFEDEDVIVVNKPSGLVVHPAPGHPRGTLVNALLHHCDGLSGVGGVLRPGIVHRLDRDTSGLMMVAKHDAALRSLAQSLKQGAVEKVYLCIVHGIPARAIGSIDAAIGRHAWRRTSMAVRDIDAGSARAALSHYRLLENWGRTGLMEVRIATGRTHQIRVHMAHIGHPVVGDARYGGQARDRALPAMAERQMLHAWRLAFPHPVRGTTIAFEQSPPSDFMALADWLRSRSRTTHGSSAAPGREV